MRAQDLERRERVMELVAANELHAAEDYDDAAHIVNHGDASEWLRQASKRWCGRKTLN